jgi:hypothetical protein
MADQTPDPLAVADSLKPFLDRIPMNFTERNSIVTAEQLLRDQAAQAAAPAPDAPTPPAGSKAGLDVSGAVDDLRRAYERCGVNSPSSAQDHIQAALDKLGAGGLADWIAN